MEQRQCKGIDSMYVWVTLVETIFRKRGSARQEKIDTWLTRTTPPKNWRDREKLTQTDIKIIWGMVLEGGILDPR